MAATYNLMDYDAEDEREKDPLGPPRSNLFAAASYVNKLLSANDIPFAIMGGFAMICRGSQRNTRDIDIITETTMSRLWAVITPQLRLKVPNTRLLEGVIKVFVETGPKHDDPGCMEDRLIDVDFMLPGFRGTPRQLSSHVVQLSVTTGNEQYVFPCVDALYMMRTKLQNCAARAMERDIEDMQYLLSNYGSEVSSIRDQLDQDDVDEFFDLYWATAAPPEQVAHYRRVLGR